MRRFTTPVQVRLDDGGNGQSEYSARAAVTVRHTRVMVAPLPGRSGPVLLPTAMLLLNGQEFEGTSAGWGDSSDTVHELDPGETLACVWRGGDPGALATMYVRGVSE